MNSSMLDTVFLDMVVSISTMFSYDRDYLKHDESIFHTISQKNNIHVDEAIDGWFPIASIDGGGIYYITEDIESKECQIREQIYRIKNVKKYCNIQVFEQNKNEDYMVVSVFIDETKSFFRLKINKFSEFCRETYGVRTDIPSYVNRNKNGTISFSDYVAHKKFSVEPCHLHGVEWFVKVVRKYSSSADGTLPTNYFNEICEFLNFKEIKYEHIDSFIFEGMI